MNPTVGTALQGGKYLLEQALGQGDRCLTFRATQTHQNKPVLVKIFPSDTLSNRDRLKGKWMETVQALFQCRHPALANVLAWFEEGGLPFVVMDWVMGQSLADRVRSQGAIAEPEALQYVRQVGSALSLLHRRGLVHQDVKPENLIQPIGTNLVVLVDFGGAWSEGSSGSASGSAYRAIELGFQQFTAATDIYALAATLYFLLTGKPPVPAPQRHATPLVPLRQLQPQVSQTVEAAVMAGMELDPAARPQTIAAWFSLLESVSASVPFSTPTSTNGASRTGTIELPVLVTGLDSPSPNGKVPPAASKPTLQNSSKPSTSPRRRIPRSFVVGAALAGTIGLGVGLVLRVSGGTGPGSSFFHTEQAFPKKNTAGVTPSVDEQFSPPAQPSLRRGAVPELPDFDSAPAPARSIPDPPEPALLPERRATPRRAREPIIPEPADSPTVEPAIRDMKPAAPRVEPVVPVEPAPIPPPPVQSAPPPVAPAPPAAEAAPINPPPPARSPRTGG